MEMQKYNSTTDEMTMDNLLATVSLFVNVAALCASLCCVVPKIDDIIRSMKRTNGPTVVYRYSRPRSVSRSRSTSRSRSRSTSPSPSSSSSSVSDEEEDREARAETSEEEEEPAPEEKTEPAQSAAEAVFADLYPVILSIAHKAIETQLFEMAKKAEELLAKNVEEPKKEEEIQEPDYEYASG